MPRQRLLFVLLLLALLGLYSDAVAQSDLTSKSEFESLWAKLPADNEVRKFLDRNSNGKLDENEGRFIRDDGDGVVEPGEFDDHLEFAKKVLETKSATAGARLPRDAAQNLKPFETMVHSFEKTLENADTQQPVASLYEALEGDVDAVLKAYLIPDPASESERTANDAQKGMKNGVAIITFILDRDLTRFRQGQTTQEQVASTTVALASVLVAAINEELTRTPELDVSKLGSAGNRGRGGVRSGSNTPGSRYVRSASGSYASYESIVENYRRYKLRMEANTRAYRIARKAIRD